MKHHKQIRFILCTLLLELMIGGSVFGNTIQLQEQLEKVALGSHLEYFEDKDSTLTIRDVTALPKSLFKSAELDVLNFGFTHSTYWVRFSIINQSDIAHKLLIEYQFPLTGSVERYLIDHADPSDIELVRLGAKYTYNQKKIKVSTL